MNEPTRAEERKRKEAEFFDRQAAARAASLKPINPLIIERYAQAHPDALYALEHAVAMAMPLKGTRVLVAGCGEGDMAVIFATLGAQVVGVDISPGAIEVGRRLAEVSGVADSIEWVVAPLEDMETEGLGTFEVVWCNAILHHLIDDFQDVVDALWARVAPGGRAVILEPYSLMPAWRWVRLNLLPKNPNVTEDERPLEPTEIGYIEQTLGDVSFQSFDGFSRFTRFVLGGHTLEGVATWRRGIADGLGRIDRLVLSGGLGAKLGSRRVWVGRKPKPS